MNNRQHNDKDVLILGAGLAGLTAADVLSAANQSVTVIEAAADVGGLARTIEHNGFRFDLGGHRFVTDNAGLERYVRKLLGEDCLCVSRSSKILLAGRYFDYPLRPLNAISGFGVVMTVSILFDYLRQRLVSRFIKTQPLSLKDWVISHFGRTLFDIYFRDYSEKVWGIDCQRIDMSWMQQRVQGLSLAKAIKHSLLASRRRQLATLSNRFLYPRWGIGQIADKLTAKIRQSNSVHTGMRVLKLNHSNLIINNVEVQQAGQKKCLSGDSFISSIPLPALVRAMNPSPPAKVVAAASQLGSRDLLTVTLMLNCAKVTDQSWIYLPEKKIAFGRLHEPSNWSACLSPEGKTHLVLEYFCTRGDSIWNASDKSLTDSSIDQLVTLGLIKCDMVFDSLVTRIANAYPLFEVGYQQHCQTIYDYLDQFSNLYTAGRSGMFRYYNMDHAMMAGIDAAEKIMQTPAPVAACRTDDVLNTQTLTTETRSAVLAKALEL
ncbi:MAG: FAD-dependent oxidoreductase [Gammaproteobacteria bacterium]|nr:FAD-dependent oxidoreductase [Gammaproteobacteria bacterium]